MMSAMELEKEMKSSLIVIFALGTLLGPPILAQDVKLSQADDYLAAKIVLGRTLFRSSHLSGNKQMTCATCHEPGLSFTDGSAESPGILGSGVGRNAPTMLAIGHIKHFPGPNVLSSNPLKGGRALTLSERCLVPIENPLEMASSVADAVERLSKTRGMRASFAKAYGPGILGITPKRIGDALATYLRTVEAPSSPYRDLLEGNQPEMTAIEKRGLELFNGSGKCASCHSGKGLSDGLLHPAFLPGSKRDLAQTQRSLALARDARQRFKNLGVKLPQSGIGRDLFERLAPPPQQQGCDATMGSSRNQRTTYDGQDPNFRQMHTLSLWDVSRTAPYFRDGSAKTLIQAVQSHVGELRAVRANWGKIRSIRKQVERRPETRTAKKLQPKWAKSTKKAPAPEDLTPGDLRALVAFMVTFSPRD
ncbi:MAG: cytochrome c peroxidase [Planctomycetota bacterium]|jgi:cytochrome c peroxidase